MEDGAGFCPFTPPQIRAVDGAVISLLASSCHDSGDSNNTRESIHAAIFVSLALHTESGSVFVGT
jgi:hypothetical protein